jgi:DNA-binding SARP family transcriptional activator
MRIRILGPVEIQDDIRGRRLAVSGVQRPALLATLVVRAGRTVSTDKLIQELWGADPPANAANALQAHVKRLRRLFCSACGEPDRIRTRTPGYTLHLTPGETDAEEFTTRVTEARALTALTPDRAIPLLRAALALWRGPALDGCAQGDICRAEAAILEENRLSALETLYDACLRANRHREIIGELEEATTTHPLRERLHDQLMLALYRCDRQSEAIGVYDRVRRRLLTDLGAEPGPALRATIHAILTQSAHILPEPGPRSLIAELAALQHQLDTVARRQAALREMIGNTTPA